MPRISRERLIDLLLFASLAVLQCVVLMPLAQQRLIARDEGYYVYAAKLVNQGEIPYIDFFYPQMPLLPFIYGGWMQVFGETWYSARSFSAFLAVTLGLLCCLYARLLLGRTAALLAGLLYSSSTFVIPWYLSAQTYTLSTLFLFSSCTLLRFPPLAGKSWFIFAAGILFGLAIDVRLLFASIGPAIVLYILLTEAPLKRRVWDVLLFSSGTFAGLLPSLAYMLGDLDRFLFNSLGWALDRSAETTQESLRNKLALLRVFFGLEDSVEFDAPQPALLLYASFLGGLLTLLIRRKIDLVLYVAAALFVTNFIPTPTYVQYLAPLIPFLIVSALVPFALLWKLAKQHKARLLAAAATLAFLYFYTYKVPSDIERYTRTGEGVIGIQGEENAANWNLEMVREISASVNQNSNPGDTVLSFWPGYLLETKARAHRGLENQFGPAIASRLSMSDRRKYRLIGKREVDAAIESGTSEIVLYAKNRQLIRGRELDLLRLYYRLKVLGPIAIYKIKPGQGPQETH